MLGIAVPSPGPTLNTWEIKNEIHIALLCVRVVSWCVDWRMLIQLSAAPCPATHFCCGCSADGSRRNRPEYLLHCNDERCRGRHVDGHRRDRGCERAFYRPKRNAKQHGDSDGHEQDRFDEERERHGERGGARDSGGD